VHHQIVLPYVGSLELEIAGRGGRVAQGVGAFIVTGAAHAFLAKGTNSFLVVDLVDSHFSSQRLAALFDRREFFPINPPLQGLVDYATARLDRTRARGIMEHWTALLLDSLMQRRPICRCSETDAVRRAMRFMRAHAAERIRIRDIAAEAGLSDSRLYALFDKHIGQSPHAVLATYRVEAARWLLVESNFSIAEIAARTGHADQSALTRRLREALGTTPAALRRSSRAAPRRVPPETCARMSPENLNRSQEDPSRPRRLAMPLLGTG